MRAYLANGDLAAGEGRVERFFINVVLLRVLYAHALVAAPRLALGWLSRVLPNSYPLGDDVAPFVADENGFGRLLDYGIIQPRLRALYDWSARELGQPEVAGLLVGDIPAYAWDPAQASDWTPPPRTLARLARQVVPAGA